MSRSAALWAVGDHAHDGNLGFDYLYLTCLISWAIANQVLPLARIDVEKSSSHHLS